MPVELLVLGLLVGLPAILAALIILRVRAKERLAEAWLGRVGAALTAAGAERLDRGLFRWEGRVVRVQASPNPLVSRAFTVRISAYSDTVDEFELRRGRPVPEGCEAFAGLLDRWESAGKQVTECYAASVTTREDLVEDLRRVIALAKLPRTRVFKGGIFTWREGFEAKCPQVHWRHDLRAKLPEGVHRACISYWSDGPLLNQVLLRVLWELAPGSKYYFISDVEDLGFLDHSFDPALIRRHDTLIELGHPDLPWAADLTTDGRFFGGLLAADSLPKGFEGRVPQYSWLERAVAALPEARFYVRRLDDDERAWYSGEYEILSLQPLPVRQAIEKVALEIGATAMVIERRFHKRMVVQRSYD